MPSELPTMIGGFALLLVAIGSLFGISKPELHLNNELATILTGTIGVMGIFLLIEPDRHRETLDQISQLSWAGVCVVLLPLGRKTARTVLHAGFLVSVACLIGAIGTKSAELSTPGPQHDLHFSNTLLLLVGFMGLIGIMVKRYRELKPQQPIDLAEPVRVRPGAPRFEDIPPAQPRRVTLIKGIRPEK